MDRHEDLPAGPLERLRIIQWAQAQAGQEWIRTRGLTMQQAFVLSYLADNPGAIQRDIARATRTSAANVSGVLRGLQARHLVQRGYEDGDERSKRVFATDAGIALIAGRAEAMAAVDESILAPLTEPEQATLRRLLDKIIANLPDPGGP